MELPNLYVASDIITIRSNAFLREGMTFTKVILSQFPSLIDGRVINSLALISESDKPKVDKIWEDLRDLPEEPSEDELKAVLKKAPKRVWASSLLRECVVTNATTQESDEFLPGGSFAVALRTKCGGDDIEDITFEAFEKAVKSAITRTKKLVIHHKKDSDGKNYFALSSKNKKYPIWDYCIE